MHEPVYTTTRSIGTVFRCKRCSRDTTMTALVLSLDAVLLRCMVVQFSSHLAWCGAKLRQ